jgi:sugar-specific transcriptional regulator TrmB
MMIKGAKKSAVIVTTAEGLNRKFEALKPTIEKAKKRGVDVKIAAEITEDNTKVAKDLSKVAEVRAVKKSHGRFAIIDDEQMMFLLLDDKEVHPNYDVGVWLSSGFFANSLSQMFDSAWKDFSPLGKGKKK